MDEHIVFFSGEENFGRISLPLKLFLKKIVIVFNHGKEMEIYVIRL
jgi:hypothetical protein